MFYDYLAGYIQTRIDEGAFRPIDPLLAARAFIGMVVHHRLLHEISTPCTVPTKRLSPPMWNCF